MDPAPDRLDAIAVGCFAFLVLALVALAWLRPAAPAWVLLSQLVASATLLAALALGRPGRRQH